MRPITRQAAEIDRLNATADPDGRIYQCALCNDLTGYPATHLSEKHGRVRIAVADFRLIRGALHKRNTQRGRAAIQTETFAFPE